MTGSGDRERARACARSLGLIHNVTYYTAETRAFGEVGIPEFWRAYMAYRCAPLGPVGVAAGTAVLYNFAPRMVADGLPSVWELISPADAIELRNECLDRAVAAGLGDVPGVAEAADLAMAGIDGVDSAGRALFGAHADLAVPDAPHLRLWHACTLWREHRGDSHNIALAAAGIDGLEAHVLLAAKGVGSAAVIGKIRGWNSDEWSRAAARLADRGLLTTDGDFTPRGRQLRADIEDHTDQLSAAPRDRLGPEATDRLLELTAPIAERLVETGAVSATWPPKKPISRGAPS